MNHYFDFFNDLTQIEFHKCNIEDQYLHIIRFKFSLPNSVGKIQKIQLDLSYFHYFDIKSNLSRTSQYIFY